MVGRPVFHQLEPPAWRGRLTMLEVPIGGDPNMARGAAYAWAEDVWTAWAAHHQTVRAWLEMSGLGTQE
jgi:hypothetical protein